MADPTQDQSQDTATPVGALLGPPPGSLGDLTKGMADIQRKRTAADEAAIGRNDRLMAADRAQIQRAFEAEGHGPDELKPWDANKEHEKFETNPLEGFGSPGALFAMVASAFTRAPMENAILGMAGALNGIKETNEASYQRAYESWKENMKLAEQRHKMQHEAYQDALSLADHDVAASNAKLRENAVRFGDQQALFLLEHGMSKELYELIDARNKSMTQATQAADALQERGLKQEVLRAQLENVPKTGNPAVDAAHKLNAFQRVFGQKQTPQQELMGQFFADHPNATAEEAADFADKHGIIRLYGTAGAGGAGSNIPGRVETEMVRKRAAELREKDPSLSETEAYTQAKREIDVQSKAPSANRVDDLRNLNNQADNVIEKSNKVISFLETHKGGAGLLGKILRGEEIAGNILGTTETDRAQMRRDILEIQDIAPQILSGRSGRALASEQKKVDSVIAGLEAGDTSANTLRAYRDLLKDIEKRKKDFQGRIEGGYKPGEKSSGTGIADPAKAEDDSWYKSAPLVGDK